MRSHVRSGIGGRVTLATGMVAMLLVLAASALRAQGSRALEHQVKAVFLLRLAQFVDWPPEAFAAQNSPVVIGILGSDPIGAFLDETVRNETLAGRPFVIQRYRALHDIEVCHILFVGRSETLKIVDVIAELKARPILTVSDIEGFSRSGGIVRLVTVEGRIRLRINVNAARDAKLTISSKLLRLAEIVTTEAP